MIYLVTAKQELFESPLYEIITVKRSLELLQSCNLLQYDSETTGRNAHINKLLCVQFGNKALDIQIVVDTTTVDIMCYKDILESKYLIMQNGKFDLQFLYSVGIIPTKIYDTMIVEQLLYLGFPPKGKPGGIGFSLDAIAYRYLNIDIDKSIRGDIIWRGLDSYVIQYAANDVKWLEDIMELQIIKCKQFNCLYGAKLECDFVPIVAYLEWCGITLDKEKWQLKMQEDKNNLSERKAALDLFTISTNNSKFYKINNQGDLFQGFDSIPICTINWSSQAQVIKFVKYLGFDTNIVDKKTGEEKDTVVEKHLAGQKGINDEFLSLYFAYQESSKVVSTYGQNYLNAINPITNRIHTVFRQLGASSGRMTCGSRQSDTDLAKLKQLSPNQCTYVQLQTLPSDHTTRSSFIAGEGRLFCSADFSGLEARLGADIYNESSMIKEFLEGSGDIHSLVARACFKEISDKTTEEIKKDFPHLRKRAKPIGFCFQFGGSAYAAKDSLNCTLEEAQAIMDNYLKGFPGISTFKNIGSKFVKQNGYILMNPITGHRLNWYDHNEWLFRSKSFTSSFWEEYRNIKQHNPQHPVIKEVSNHFKASSKYDRLALNSVTQATGAIILKQSCIYFFKWILDNKLFNIVKINNLVHDEINIDYPEYISEASTVLKECMEKAAAVYCKKLPIPAEISVGNYWIH